MKKQTNITITSRDLSKLLNDFGEVYFSTKIFLFYLIGFRSLDIITAYMAYLTNPELFFQKEMNIPFKILLAEGTFFPFLKENVAFFFVPCFSYFIARTQKIDVKFVMRIILYLTVLTFIVSSTLGVASNVIATITWLTLW